jgi:signal transduction histidine kinase
VKTVIDLHRGDVWVESEEGNGSRFTVRLPAITTPHEALVGDQQPAS